MKALWENVVLAWGLIKWFCSYMPLMLWVDATVPGIEQSCSKRLVRNRIWSLTRLFGVQWRINEPLSAGFGKLWQLYRDKKKLAREYRQLERKLAPVMRAAGSSGESPEEFVKRLPELLRLANIGDQAMQEGWRPAPPGARHPPSRATDLSSPAGAAPCHAEGGRDDHGL